MIIYPTIIVHVFHYISFCSGHCHTQLETQKFHLTLQMADIPDNAPAACPGTSSEAAGRSSACAGCPNQRLCASGIASGPDPAASAICERLANVKRKILILSGKGGVGKSSVSTCLSLALAFDQSRQIGLLDIDICGPSIPLMTNTLTASVHQSGAGWSPVFVTENLAVMSIGYLLSSPDEAVIWRGPKKNGMIAQFLRDVDWGPLDWLLIDCPPGTSDEHLSAARYLKPTGLDGAVLVTTPQEVALMDVRKEVNFCKKMGIPILGVVENMTDFACPSCSQSSIIFPATTGGATQLCQDMGLELLGRVTLDPLVGRALDDGLNPFEVVPNSPAVEALRVITEKLVAKLVISQDATVDPENGEMVQPK